MNQKSFITIAIFSISSLLLLSSYKKKWSDSVESNATEEVNKNVTPDQKQQSKIQLVFALDATGSMSGLINAAKEKIWGIASSMTQAEQAPQIEVGLLFYRDRGDEFVTQMVPLSQNLDDVYEKLMKIQAGGGGDSPESVNQALSEAVTRFQWDANEDNTYKSIFLVGDCPPHMDYQDDVKFPISCEHAKKSDIFLNTILMGNNKEAEAIWKQIANFNQGSFTKVDMNVNDISIPTPYDAEIAKLSDKMDDMRYYYGDEKVKSTSLEKKNKSITISKNAAPIAKVQRAEYNSTNSGKDSYIGKNELINDIKENKIAVEKIPVSQLPDDFKHLSTAELKKELEAKSKEKEETQKRLSETLTKRKVFLEEEMSKKGSEVVDNSFSNVIYNNIKTQSSKKNIKLSGKAKF